MSHVDSIGHDQLEDHYVEQVNLAVAEDRDDLVHALSTRYAATRALQASDGPHVSGTDTKPRDGRSSERPHGPLSALLVGLTVVTGQVDAFSYLSLGHVFVANMTGNVVFVGFGLAGAGGISVVASLFAVLAFAIGAATGGRWSRRRALHRGHLLAVAASAQALLVVAAAIVTTVTGTADSATRLVLIALLAIAMGGQNAIARRLAVPDMTTTVLTLTVTGLVADATTTKVRIKRMVPVAAMLAGALAGGLLLRWVNPAAPLWAAAVLLVACAIWAASASHGPHAETWR
jgi:uncharacterized membrane protein YoaK (UPF0700 family)